MVFIFAVYWPIIVNQSAPRNSDRINRSIIWLKTKEVSGHIFLPVFASSVCNKSQNTICVQKKTGCNGHQIVAYTHTYTHTRNWAYVYTYYTYAGHYFFQVQLLAREGGSKLHLVTHILRTTSAGIKANIASLVHTLKRAFMPQLPEK